MRSRFVSQKVPASGPVLAGAAVTEEHHGRRVSDMIGRKRAFLLGVAGFGIASLSAAPRPASGC
jgi:hypothetical protein